MNRVFKTVAALALVSLPLAPAYAGWKVIAPGVETKTKSGLISVSPTGDWNRFTGHPMKKGEVWSIDGPTLNELYFVSALAAGETLYKEYDKKNNPLPKLGASLQLTDVPEFFESSFRVAAGSSLFQVTGSEPAQFGGRPAIKFSFDYSVEGSPLVRKGIAIGSVVDNKLYLISFAAPSTYYFDRDRAKAEAIMASAKF